MSIGTDAAAAVGHAGHHEKPEEVLGAGAILAHRLFVVIHAHHGLQDRIRPTIGHKQLAAAFLEFGKIRILRIGQLAPGVEEMRVAVEV